MNKSIKINSFNEFWPVYLNAHSSRASRAFHVGGMVLSLGAAAALLSCGMIFFLVLAVVPAQVGAFIGHKLSPRAPDVSADHPDWAAFADIKMFALAVTGRLGRELEKIAPGSSPVASLG